MKGFGKTSAVVGAIVATAALTASPAGARLIVADSEGGAQAGSVATGSEGRLGLTGDSPLTRVSAPDPEGLTGDSALTRAREPIAATQARDGGERWSWVGIGSGAGAVLLAAALSLAVGQRRRVALP